MKYLLNKGMERDARQLALLIPRVRRGGNDNGEINEMCHRDPYGQCRRRN